MLALLLLLFAAPDTVRAQDRSREDAQSLADMYVAFGKSSYEAGLYGDAVHDFRNALKLVPGHPEAIKYLKLLGEPVDRAPTQPSAPRWPAPRPALRPTVPKPPVPSAQPPHPDPKRDAAMEDALRHAQPDAPQPAKRPAPAQPLRTEPQPDVTVVEPVEVDEDTIDIPVKPLPEGVSVPVPREPAIAPPITPPQDIQPPISVPVAPLQHPPAPTAPRAAPADAGAAHLVLDGAPVPVDEPVMIEQGQPLVPLRPLAERLGYQVVPLPDGSIDVTSPDGQRRRITPTVPDPRMLLQPSELEDALGFARVRFDDAERAVLIETVPAEGFQSFEVPKTPEQLQAQAAHKSLVAGELPTGSVEVAEGMPKAARPDVDLHSTVTYSYDDPHAAPPFRTLTAYTRGRAGEFDVAFESVRKDANGIFDHDYTYLNLNRPDLFIGMFDQRLDLYPLRTQFEEFNGLRVRKVWEPGPGGPGISSYDSFRPLEPRAGAGLATSAAWGATETFVSGRAGTVKYQGTLGELRQDITPTDWLRFSGSFIHTDAEADDPAQIGTSPFPRTNNISYGQAAMLLPQDLSVSMQVARSDYAPDENPDEHSGDWDIRTSMAWDRERYRLRAIYEVVGDEYASVGDPRTYQDYRGAHLLGTFRVTDGWLLNGSLLRFSDNVDEHPDQPTFDNQILSLSSGHHLSQDQSIYFTTTHTLTDPSGPTDASASDGSLYGVDYSRPFLGDTRLLASYQYSRNDLTTDPDSSSHSAGLSLFKVLGPGSSWYASQRVRQIGRDEEDDGLELSTSVNFNYRVRPELQTYVNSTYSREVGAGAGQDAIGAALGFRYELTPDTMLGAEYEIGPYDVDRESGRWPREWSLMFILQKQFGLSSGPNFGRIEGLVFYDSNGNGQHDPGEPGADGATAGLQGSDRKVLSDAGGRFVFSRLPPGSEEVRVDIANLEADWILVAPRQAVPVERRRTSRVWFPLMKAARIAGTVFIDHNGDGLFQDTDEPLEDVSVVLLPGQDFRRTAPDGAYDFEFLPAGDYQVQLYLPDLPRGYELGSPGTVDVGLRGGEEREDVNFAVRLVGEVQRFE